MNNIRMLAAVALSLTLVACGGGGGCALGGLAGCGNSSAGSSTSLVALAGADQTVLTGSTVTLNATASTGASNLTYLWTWSYKPAGSQAALSSATSAKPTFTADVSGSYALVLTVSDGRQNSTPVVTTVKASVANVAPVANAGVNQSVLVGSSVTLDGTASTDANGDALTYAWVLSAPAGSSAKLSSTTSPKPAFVADIKGTYQANLVVSDSVLSSEAFVRVEVSVANAAPVANAGSDQSVVVSNTVTLDGSGSTDANLDVLIYNWSLLSKPTGSMAALDSATAIRPKFTADKVGAYVFSLSVNDGKSSSANNSVVTVVASAVNAAPVANAGASQSVVTGSVVTLNGAGSSDANGDALTYKWTLVSKPAASTATLSSVTVVSPTFTADLAGTYVAVLVVNDGKVDSAALASTSVTAAAPNVAPVAQAGTAQTVAVGATVTLNGSSSTDANGDVLTYRWALTSVPTGSKATLDKTNVATVTFTPDLTGSFIATLVVNDGKVDSNPSTVLITVTPTSTGVTGTGGAGG